MYTSVHRIPPGWKESFTPVTGFYVHWSHLTKGWGLGGGGVLACPCSQQLGSRVQSYWHGSRTASLGNLELPWSSCRETRLIWATQGCEVFFLTQVGAVNHDEQSSLKETGKCAAPFATRAVPGMGVRFPTYSPTMDVICEQKQTSRTTLLWVKPFKKVLLWLEKSLHPTFASLDNERVSWPMRWMV